MEATDREATKAAVDTAHGKIPLLAFVKPSLMLEQMIALRTMNLVPFCRLWRLQRRNESFHTKKSTSQLYQRQLVTPSR